MASVAGLSAYTKKAWAFGTTEPKTDEELPSTTGTAAGQLMFGMLTVSFALALGAALLEAADVVEDWVPIWALFASSSAATLLMVRKMFRSLVSMETQHRGAERLLSEIVRASPVWICVKDLSGQRILANECWKSCHLDADHAVPLDPGEIEVMRSSGASSIEEVICPAPEEAEGKRIVLVSRFPLHNFKGRMVGVASFGMDVTSLRTVADELRRSEEGFRAVADCMPVIVWTADGSGRVTYFNRRWELEMGRSAESCLGNAWTDLIHPDDLEPTFEAWTKAMTSVVAFHVEHRALQADGNYHWRLVRGHPTRDDEGNAVKWFGTSIDIDEQKRIAWMLERKVEERTEALLQANKELESFSYSVSHDLRAPLRTISYHCERLLEAFADVGADAHESTRGSLGRIARASHTMSSLIDALLELSRVSRTELVRESVDLSALANEIFDEKRRCESSRRVDVHIESGLRANADSSLVRIVLWNLLDNAWKFTSRSVPARISLEAGAEVGSFIIRDNGAGFDPSKSSQLFKAFERLHSEAEFPGTGIGLVTVDRVLTRHGGWIRVEAAPGQGAAFTFSFGQGATSDRTLASESRSAQ